MKNDLDINIRTLIDVAQPVSASEAVAFASSRMDRATFARCSHATTRLRRVREWARRVFCRGAGGGGGVPGVADSYSATRSPRQRLSSACRARRADSADL